MLPAGRQPSQPTSGHHLMLAPNRPWTCVKYGRTCWQAQCGDASQHRVPAGAHRCGEQRAKCRTLAGDTAVDSILTME